MQAVSSMLPFLRDMWGTFSAPHLAGQELQVSIAESYKSIYDLIGAKESDDFVFTSSAAEAINQAILSAYFNITMTTGKNHYLTSHIDDAPTIMSLGRLEKFDCVCKMVTANKSGQVTAEILAEAITPRTAMISLSWANGLTGVINPVAEIGQLCRERGIALHLDATHVLGKLYFDLEDVSVDFLSFSGDHLHAPKGTGGLWVKAGQHCSPLIIGGIEQGGLRAGNLNVAGLVALGQAAKEAVESRDLLCTEVARLRDMLEMGIVAHYPEAMPFYQAQERLPHCTTIAFPGIVNETLLYALNRQGVYACIGGGSFQQLALMLKGAGVAPELAQTALSFSLSRETTENEIDKAIEIIAATVKKLSKMSYQGVHGT